MKVIVSILAFLNGGYMLADGAYVIINHKYIGPERPGPWSKIFEAIGIDNVYSLGPLFIIFGLCWLTWLYSFLTRKSWCFGYGIILCILTLWYLPVGTLFSLIIMGILVTRKRRLGL